MSALGVAIVFHSEHEKVHHESAECPIAQRIPLGERIPGDGGKPVCPACRRRARRLRRRTHNDPAATSSSDALDLDDFPVWPEPLVPRGHLSERKVLLLMDAVEACPSLERLERLASAIASAYPRDLSLAMVRERIERRRRALTRPRSPTEQPGEPRAREE